MELGTYDSGGLKWDGWVMLDPLRIKDDSNNWHES